MLLFASACVVSPDIDSVSTTVRTRAALRMTTQARASDGRGRPQTRAPALAGLAIWLVDAMLSLGGITAPGISLGALMLAPGLALAGLLPASVRKHGLALTCVIPVLGYAAASVVLITVSRVGIELNPLSIRLALLTTIVIGLALLPFRGGIERPRPSELALLALAVAAGAFLQAQVLRGYPVPGNDWAKYLLYADEIRRQGSLLIDNPFWMLGVPFREDPGVPSVYGSFLLMSDEATGTLAHGIWVFALLGIMSVFAYVRSLWGPLAGGLAALLYAVVPMNQDILGWHGLANVAALALMPLVFIYATELFRGRLAPPEACGFGLALVALAATHRLSFSLTMVVLAIAGLVALALGDRRAIARSMAITAAAVIAIGWGVASDLVLRSRTFGGTQGYEAYLNSKLDIHLVILDLTWPFAIAAALAVIFTIWKLRARPVAGLMLVLLGVCAIAGYSWLVHFPLSYLRMAYYLPLALVPLIAIASISVTPRRPALGAIAGVALCALITVFAYGRAGDVRTYYTFTDAQSVRGLEKVAESLRPNEVVVTDRCWSFLSTWLLHTRTLPALAPEDIQPKAELATARTAQQVLEGLPEGITTARRLGVRYILVDPACTDPSGRPISPPLIGIPRYASKRLVVLEMPPDPRNARSD